MLGSHGEHLSGCLQIVDLDTDRVVLKDRKQSEGGNRVQIVTVTNRAVLSDEKMSEGERQVRKAS